MLGLAGCVVVWQHCRWCLPACGGMGLAMYSGWDLMAGWQRVAAMLADRIGDGFEGVTLAAAWQECFGTCSGRVMGVPALNLGGTGVGFDGGMGMSGWG